MSGRLAGKRAFITAAGMGIGRATAETFLREGAQVIATDINMDALSDLKQGDLKHENVIVEHLDARDGAAIAAAAERHGAVDILFNCAGFVHNGTLLEATEDEWDFAFDLNVKSMYRVCRAFLPAMLENGGGSIVNTSSVASAMKGIVSRCVYSASKAAVTGLTKSIAADYVGQGVRCNAIAPGTVDTPSLGDRINAADDPVQQRKDFIARQPMGRLGTAQEVANLVLFLASDESAFCTGQIYTVDGGVVM
ncbi:MAG: SDR family oxidoreductase [Rhodospirillaceae bacterium]|jgi:2-keto-3-deoxy-L-fuconate dehydrogenase|nr:SDR family oxidoreductase [Rhodospirillaceae bacterium]MBT4688571.1 SDR family oxidoreductase [Rhodospirillaceae bacterium]MBT5080977.1 SDR family oxidoreductase [Rhodospirillaceae bacterium]MBT5527356.1 SDR family oxidoreductase [Rhodospirillaceae bacterium]MBT5878364.1 SDR family oxidoreductase [Rhodospirillaceae bacterium]